MKFDLIVIGSSQHGMTAAALCAKRGLKVCVVDQSKNVGGMNATYEFYPGFRSPGVWHDDTHVWPEVLKDLEINDVRLSDEPYSFWTWAGKAWAQMSTDVATTEASLKSISQKDAAKYGEYRAQLARFAKFVRPFMRQTLMGLDLQKNSNLLGGLKAALRLRLLGKRDMLELLRSSPMCIADALNDVFETPALKGALSLPSVTGAFTGPWSPLSTLNHYLWECLQTSAVGGGSTKLIGSLKTKCDTLGVTFQMNTTVKKIEIEGGVAKGITTQDGRRLDAKMVLSTLDPKTTFLDLVDPNELRVDFSTDVSRIRSRGTHAKLTLALSTLPTWNQAPSPKKMSRVRLAPTLDDVERSFDCLKYGTTPNAPAMDVFVPTLDNPQLAPSGKHVLSALVYGVPYVLTGEDWTPKSRAAFQLACVGQLERLSPGIKNSIEGSELLLPKDIEAMFGTQGGHLFHGEHAPDQLFMMRPVPKPAHSRTPIANLFHASSGSHPGGGLTCAAGWFAAKEILKG